MTKHLRLIMLSLLAMICMGGYSQSETVFKTLSFPDENQQTNTVQNYSTPWTAKIGDDTWSIDNCNNNNWNNGWKHIAMGSKRGATVASIATDKPLTAAITKVVVNYGTVVNLPKNLNSLKLIVASDNGFNNDVETIDGDKSFSTDGQSTFTITTPAEGRYFKLVYDLNKTVDEKNKAKNGVIQIKTVVYYTKPASSKTPTTTTFGTNYDGKTFNFVDGVLEGWKAPTATQTLAGVDGKISYESDKQDVATVDANGQLTFKSYGTATITATFTPKDTEKYAESTASYTVINKRTPTTITFGEEVDNNTFEVKDGETVVTRVATVTPVGATGSIVYESSDEAIAKVDATTGAITLGAKYGTAVITAQFVATGSFADSEAKYSIKHVGDFVFYESFDKCNGEGGIGNSWSGSLSGDALSDKATDNPGWTFVNGRERNQCASFGTTDDGGSATSPNIQIDQKAQLKFKAACWNTKAEKSQITISVSNGTLTYNGKNSQSVTIDMVKAVWTDYSMIVSGTKSFTVKFAGSGKNNRFFLDEVMVIKVAPQEITLDENGDNNVEAAENVNVTLKRTFYKDGEWNTLCLPFAVADAKTAFDGAELREVDTEKSNGNTIVFKEATAIEAGKPYLIKWANSSAAAVNVEKKFEGVTLVAAATPVEVNNGGISFNGFYKMTEASELGASIAAIGAGNKLFKVTEGKMKGFRAAFVLPSGAEATKYKVVIDGTATGIEDLVIDGVKANGRVYNLNGQYVGNSLNGLQPGLYIQNGKKIIVK